MLRNKTTANILHNVDYKMTLWGLRSSFEARLWIYVFFGEKQVWVSDFLYLLATLTSDKMKEASDTWTHLGWPRTF